MRIWMPLLGMTLFPLTIHTKPAQPQVIDYIVPEVNDDIITLSDLNQELERLVGR